MYAKKISYGTCSTSQQCNHIYTKMSTKCPASGYKIHPVVNVQCLKTFLPKAIKTKENFAQQPSFISSKQLQSLLFSILYKHISLKHLKASFFKMVAMYTLELTFNSLLFNKLTVHLPRNND